MFREEQLELAEKLMAVMTSCATSQDSLQVSYKTEEGVQTALLNKIGVIYLDQIRAPENFVDITLPAPKSTYSVLNKTNIIGSDNYPKVQNEELAVNFVKTLRVSGEEEHLIPLSTVRDAIASPRSCLAFCGRDLYTIDNGEAVWYSLQNKVEMPVLCVPTKATRAVSSLLALHVKDDCYVAVTSISGKAVLKFIAPKDKIAVAVVCSVMPTLKTTFNCAGKQLEIVDLDKVNFKEIKEKDMEKITLDSLQKKETEVVQETCVEEPVKFVEKADVKLVESEKQELAPELLKVSFEDLLEQILCIITQNAENAKTLSKLIKQLAKQHKIDVKTGGNATKVAELEQQLAKTKKALAAFTA